MMLFSELAVAQGVELPDSWAYVAEAARRAGPTRMRANLAFFNSSVGDHGEFTDVREEELTVGYIFRAAFQNMTDNYERCAHRLITPSDPTPPWSNLVFSGGLGSEDRAASGAHRRPDSAWGTERLSFDRRHHVGTDGPGARVQRPVGDGGKKPPTASTRPMAGDAMIQPA